MYIARSLRPVLGRARSFGSAVPLLAHIQEAISASSLAYPHSLLQPQDLTQFAVPIKLEDGFETSVDVFSASYSQGGNCRYVQVSFSEKAGEGEAQARAMALQMMAAGVGLPIASTAVVVAEAEDEFTASERSQLFEALSSRLSHLNSQPLLFSSAIKHKPESCAISALSILKPIIGSPLAGKRFGFTHFSSYEADLVRLIGSEKGKVVWLSEARGACAKEDGVGVEDILKHFKTHGTVKGFDGGETVGSVGLLWRMKRDVLVLSEEAGLNLMRDSPIVAESGFFSVPPSSEQKFSGVLVPSILFNTGELISAFLTYVLSTKALPRGWSPAPPLSQACEKLLKSKAKLEKKQQEVFLTAVKSISEYTVAETIARSQSEKVSLRSASLLRGLPSLLPTPPKNPA